MASIETTRALGPAISSCQQESLMSDEKQLTRRAMTGDVVSFSLLVKKYQQLIYRICRRYLSTSDAEDATQETFIRAFVHQKRFDPEQPIRPWLVTIARRLCLDLQRKYKINKNESLVMECEDPKINAEQSLSLKEDLQRISEELHALPEGQREAICLFYVEGMTYTEIATALEVPIGTIMTWLHRGKARLFALLYTEEKTEEKKCTTSPYKP